MKPNTWKIIWPKPDGPTLPDHTQFEIRIGSEGIYLFLRYECQGKGIQPEIKLVVHRKFGSPFGTEQLLLRRDLTRLKSFLAMPATHATVRFHDYLARAPEENVFIVLQRDVGGTEVWYKNVHNHTLGYILTLTPADKKALTRVVDTALANERSL